jgi:hypothetical protein
MNSSKRKFIYIIALLTVAMLFFASGCSQSGGENESTVSIVLIPSQAMVMVNASIAFNVTILGTNLADLIWSVNHLEGGSSELGFVQNGVYTAPPLQPTNPTLQIICRSKTDPNAAATSTIRITTPWVKTFGGLNDEVFSAVQEDSEGNYVLAGDTASFGSGVRTSWIVKSSSDGNPLWERTYSRNAGDDLYSTRIVATEDGGLVASARIFQTGEGPIFKLDQDGAVDWARTNTEDTPSGRLGSFDIKTTADGGVVMATGLNYWAAGDQYHEAYVWKLNARSDRNWRTRLKAIRPTGSYIDQDGMYSIEQTRDGGYITVGWLGKSSLSWNAQKACFLLYGHYCPDPPQYQGL